MLKQFTKILEILGKI